METVTKEIRHPPDAARVQQMVEFEADPARGEKMLRDGTLTALDLQNIATETAFWRSKGVIPSGAGYAEQNVDALDTAKIAAGGEALKIGNDVQQAAAQLGAAQGVARPSLFELLRDPKGAKARMQQMQQTAIQGDPAMAASNREINQSLAPVAAQYPSAAFAGTMLPNAIGFSRRVGTGIAEGAVHGGVREDGSALVGGAAGGVGGLLQRIGTGSPKSARHLEGAGYKELTSDKFRLDEETLGSLGLYDRFKYKLAKVVESPKLVGPFEKPTRLGFASKNQKNYNSRAIQWVGDNLGHDLSQFKRGSEELYEAVTKIVDKKYAHVTDMPTNIKADDTELASALKKWAVEKGRDFKKPDDDTKALIKEFGDFLRGSEGTTKAPDVRQILNFGSRLSEKAWEAGSSQQGAYYAMRDIIDSWLIKHTPGMNDKIITEARRAYHMTKIMEGMIDGEGNAIATGVGKRLRDMGMKPSKDKFMAETSFMANSNNEMRKNAGDATLMSPIAKGIGLVGLGGGALMMDDQKDDDGSLWVGLALTATALAGGMGAPAVRGLSRRSGDQTVKEFGKKPSAGALIGRMYGRGVVDVPVRAARNTATSRPDKAKETSAQKSAEFLKYMGVN